MRFSEVFLRAGVTPDQIEGDAELTTWVMDSRQVVPGACFVCMPSENTDSHQFLAAARDGGALAAVVHSMDGFDLARSLGLAVAFIEPGTPPLLEGPSSSRGGGWGVGKSETPELRIARATGWFSAALWRLAKVAFDNPSSKLRVIGVTGTNGKTTTAWLIRDMLTLMNVPCAYIGTLGLGLPLSASGSSRGEGAGGWGDSEELRPLANTTPFAIELNAMLAEAVSRGCQAVAMEVSSHALSEQRCDGIEFDVAVFTNLSQDHLDYHGSMEAYLAAKRRLFSGTPPRPSGERGLGGEGRVLRAVLNVGDPVGAELAREFGDRAMRFLQVPSLTPFGGIDPRTDIEGCAFDIGLTQIHLVLQSRDDGDHGFFADLGGAYNVENLIAAVSAVKGLGYSLDEITQAITTLLRPVPGRFEPVPNDAGIGIIVDYAHTPDALDKLLETARPLTQGRIITVFGCGGDRDKSKRPLMAQAAARGSDVVVITSDNPRTEDPDAIIADILAGLPEAPHPPAPSPHEGRGGVHVEPDRPKAVALAIKLAEPGDCVIIAGKGHENYQIIGRTKHPMDDRDLAREGLKQR